MTTLTAIATITKTGATLAVSVRVTDEAAAVILDTAYDLPDTYTRADLEYLIKLNLDHAGGLMDAAKPLPSGIILTKTLF